MANYDNHKAVPATNSVALYADPDGNITTRDYKFVPKNQDGSIFDCTNTATCNVTVSNMSASPNDVAVTKSMTPLVADATGITLSFSTTQADFLTAGTNVRYSIIGGDAGGGFVTLATGSLSFSLIPKAG